MASKIPCRAVFPVAGLLLFLASAAPAQDKAAATALNPKCLACHGTEILSGSVHAGLACTDCHRVSLSPGTPDLPHPKKLPPPNCTGTCHQANPLQKPGEGPVYYPDSVHGQDYLKRGVNDVARCWDCHGKHNIRKKDDPTSTVNRRNIPLLCSTCHENQAVVVKYHIHAETPYQEYRQSVHGKALFEKGLLTFAAVCTDCHGVHNIQGVGQGILMAKQPATCGRCHVLILDEYKDSIHGREALKGNSDAPLCVDCHGEHKLMSPQDERSSASRGRVPDTCSSCHARPEVMRKYGVPEDRIQTFIESMHGIASGFGSKATANCSDCHGVHDIRPASDPLSRVNPAHLAKTCGRPSCHPGMPEKIQNSKIHVGPDKKKSPVTFFVQRGLLWAVLVLIAITVVWFAAGFGRRVVRFRKK
jgi:hypothetical protein